MVFTDSPTRLGSSASKSAGLPVSIWQKSQLLVHCEPPMRNVASRSSQHSNMFGHPASWQTVWSPWSFTSECSCWYYGPIFAVILIHGGFRSIGVSLLRTSRRSSLRSGLDSGTWYLSHQFFYKNSGFFNAYITPENSAQGCRLRIRNATGNDVLVWLE